MELGLVVVTPDGATRDLFIEAEPDLPADALTNALAEHVGSVAPPGQRILARCLRTNAWLGDGILLRELGLIQGDTLRLEAVNEGFKPGAASAVSIALISGPDAGRQIDLGLGRHVFGRHRTSDVAIQDPLMSRFHFALLVTGDAVRVSDLGSANGTLVDNEPVVGERVLTPPNIVTAGDSAMRIDVPRPPGVKPWRTDDGFIEFRRPPRIPEPDETPVLALSAPPPDPQRPRLPLAAAIAPLAMGAVLFFVNPNYIVFMVLSPLMAIGSYIESKMSGKRQYKKRAALFRKELDGVTESLRAAQAQEVDRRKRRDPDPHDILERATTQSESLWERRPEDSDFLELRVGLARQSSEIRPSLAQGGSDVLRKEAEERLGSYGEVGPVPLPIKLPGAGLVALRGTPEDSVALARWLFCQAAALHSPKDLTIAAAIPESQRAEWEWMKWLPHAQPSVSPLGNGLAVGGGANELLSRASALLDQRANAQGRSDADRRGLLPFVLLLLHEGTPIDLRASSRLFEDGSSFGFGVVWVAADREVPGESDTILETKGADSLTVTDARTGKTQLGAEPDAISAQDSKELALSLAPLRDVTARRRGGQIPNRVDLLDLIGVELADPGGMQRAWSSPSSSWAAPIGVADDGPFSFDILLDGPHALIAGTTGSGKSELLQTLVGALAARHVPSSLNFLLVDYKGGAAFKEAVRLPHTVGLVTDLDAHLTRRALVSLEAEVRRREAILAAAGAKDLLDLVRHDPGNAPPRLILVIDEFATLAKEVPEFIEGVVDIAQRGRTLGLHLILATQSPAGVVTAKIRANTNLRIALRTTNEGESRDVIDAPNAASIPTSLPGRAWALTGPGQLREFQTAFVGGSSLRTGGSAVVWDLGFGSLTRSRGTFTETRVDRETELDRIVRAASEAATSMEIAQQRSPWLPPLSSVRLEAIDSSVDGAGKDDEAIVGLIDEPALQRQRPLVINLEEEGSVLVYGTGGSGKTTLLRTVAASLARATSPEDVHIYGLDFATRGLQMLEALPHVGSVIIGEDEERVQQLFSLLRRSIARRKSAFANRHVSSLSEYRRVADGEVFPRIVVLLDGYGAFASAYERVNLGQLIEQVPRLVADGRTLGVHLVITSERRGAIPSSLASLIPSRIVLAMAELDDFAGLGIQSAAYRGASLSPGRGFIEDGLELQCAVCAEDASGRGQALAMKELGDQLRQQWGDRRALGIEPLPSSIPRSGLPKPRAPLSLVLGRAEEDLEPVEVDVNEGHFFVAGPLRSGRTTTLATAAISLSEGTPGLEMHLLGPRRTSLLDLHLWRTFARGADECEVLALGLAERVERRRQGAEPLDPLVIVIDDGTELTEGKVASALEVLARRGRDLNIRVVASAEAYSAHRTYGGWITEIRKDKQGLLLDPNIDMDGDLFGTRLPRRTNLLFPPGRGYLVERGQARLVQVAIADSK